MKSQKLIFISGLLTLTGILAVMFAGVLGAMPTTVVSQDKSWKVIATAFVPESWSFFTKDPNSTALIAVGADAKDITQTYRVESLPQSLASNAFGIFRAQRSQDTEKALYAAKVQDWVDCGGMTNQECLQATGSGTPQVLESAEGSPNFCGRVILVQTKVVPYAYRNSAPYESKAEKAVRVDIKC